MDRWHAAARVAGLGLLLAGTACQERPAKVADSAPAPAGPQQIMVQTRDFAFTAPDTVRAGMSTIHLANNGPGLHHAMLFRLDSGKTMADVGAALKAGGRMPAWFVPAGGANAIAPGDSTAVTQELSAGNYLWTCFVDVPNHVPHITKGMMRPMTVLPASAGTVSAPEADIHVTLRDYAFEFSTPLTAGHHTLKVEAAPGQPHEMVLIKLAPGKTADDLMKYFDDPAPQGPPPGVPVGGVGDITSGHPVYFSADFTPGDYLVICFMPDATDGKPHFMHGMMQKLTVS